MADGSNKFKNSINLKPQSSDPSNPAEGDVFRSDGTSRTKGLWEYKDNVWTQIGSGAGGGTTINLGATVTAWQDFTPTGSWTTNTTYTGKYRRVGDTLEMSVKVVLDGAPTATNLNIDLPNGLSVDTSKLNAFSPNNLITGASDIRDNSSAANYIGAATIVNGSDQISIKYIKDNTTLEDFGNVSSTAPFVFASGDTIHIREVKVPIQGWSVADIPTSTDGVVVEGRGNDGGSLTANITNIDWTETEDTTGSWNGTQFTCPETGSYLFEGAVKITTSGTMVISAYIDGTQDRVAGFSGSSVNLHDFGITLSLNQGEVVSFRQNGSFTLDNNTNSHHIHIQKLGFNTIINREGVYKNYMEPDNSSIEEDIGDWVAYADAAATIPVDGVDGSPTITATRNTTAALRGTGDLLFTKDAANRQGEGISCPFVIDIADRAKKLTISFDYSTSANYADGDVKIFIYDLTNSNLIRVNGEDLKAVSGQSTHYAQFQTSPDSTNYRLIIHQSTTDATAYTINLDNLRVGPTSLAKGAIVTDWEDYGAVSVTASTDPSKGTTTVDKVLVKRVGDSAIIQYQYAQTAAGSAGSGTYYFDMPDGLIIDTTKLNVTASAQARNVGHGSISTTSDGRDIQVLAYTATQFQLYYANGSNLLVSSSSHPFSNTGLNFSFQVIVPIVGWSSEAVMSEDLGGRDVYAHMTTNATQTIPNTTLTTITFDNVIADTANVADTANNKFEIPESSYYDIEVYFAMDQANTTNNSRALVYYSASGTDAFLAAIPANTTSGYSLYTGNLKTTAYLNKGDDLTFKVNHNSGATATINSSLYVKLVKRSSPQTILETETVAARYSSNSGQTIGTGFTDMVYEDLDYDTHNAYNTTTGEYTVPVSGYYTISGAIERTTFTFTANTVVEVAIVVDSTNKKFNGPRSQASTSSIIAAQVTSSCLYLTKGQIVKIQARSTASSGSATTGSAKNNFEIARIK